MISYDMFKKHLCNHCCLKLCNTSSEENFQKLESTDKTNNKLTL